MKEPEKHINFAIEQTLSPRNLDADLKDTAHARAFLRTYSGRCALLRLLNVLRLEISDLTKNGQGPLNNVAEYDQTIVNETYCHTYEDALQATENLIEALLKIDNNNIEGLTDDQIMDLAKNPEKGNHALAKDRYEKLLTTVSEPEGFLDKITAAFTEKIANWRGYDPEAQRFNKTDDSFVDYVNKKNAEAKEQKHKTALDAISKSTEDQNELTEAGQQNQTAGQPDTTATPQAFSRYNGVKRMKRNTRRAFSNDQACDMLANKLTHDWFICEPQCQPLISEQLKAACVPCESFAPALSCNRLQYDGEAPVCKSELAALDKVQQFVQALKDEIANGNDCGGIKMVSAAKAFALKRQLKRNLRNFAAAGEIEIEEAGTPVEIIEAEEAGIDLDHPEKYEMVADAAEAGKIPPEIAAEGAAPAVVAPSTMDIGAMGRAYDNVLDSTIADDAVGIAQDAGYADYDPKPGELSLSANDAGAAMARMNEDTIVYEDSDVSVAQPVASVQPILADEAAAQNFSRSLHRRQASSQNFSANKPVRKPARKPVSARGLRSLLGDKYLR